MMNPESLKPGIYIGLPAEIYHADTAISRGNIVALNDTPYTYWEQSWMNPNKKPAKQSSDEMAFGEAFHCQMFEPKKFDREYFVWPTEDWDTKKKKIEKQDHEAIIAAIKVLYASRAPKQLLTGGLPEVTIVFDYDGLRFRTRHDYFNYDMTVDFKTTYSLAQWHIQSAFKKYGYDVQMYLYKLSRQRLREQMRAGEANVYGHIDEAFFKKFMESPTDDFVFIFQRSSPPYPFEALWPEDDTERNGEDKTLAALDIYERNMKKYGTSSWEISDGKLKRFSMSYGIIKE